MEAGSPLDDLLTRVEEYHNEVHPSESGSMYDGTVLSEQPKQLKDVQMKDYQMVGLNWLISRYEQNLSAILGDEMGLGKTLQSIAFLTWLVHSKEITAPSLIICPLSLVDNWEAEFNRFVPGMKVVKYMGNPEERNECQKKILNLSKKEEFFACLVTPDFVKRDSSFLTKFPWHLGIVDEAHSLKNAGSVLYQTITSEYDISHWILLTGTPLQNDLWELWALLHFIQPKEFNDQDQFIQWFGAIDKSRTKGKRQKSDENSPEEQLEILHRILRPFLLRRVKSEVENEIPPKSEIILETPLSPMQRQYYKWVLTRDSTNLNKKGSKVSLMNIIMHLRKCCDHPYLFDGAEPMVNGEFVLGEHIVENSGKLLVLDRLLVKLKKEGHRVLLFSQMTRMLDILQDYLHLRNFSYERLDGSVRGLVDRDST
eukprot:TRINITY_DN5216_c0_g1_i2.p1 TRINITY_DN5216_c0_g1~~TRINITY_DN5216_c0_g1_i2.p1  ORF type:complete len:426 (+),score=121.64 TRINITY_DN5216_c0_g1_i2:2-1279(+)